MEDNKSIFSDTYEVIDYLQSGSGGMVYKAYHKRLKKEVVLKRIKKKSANMKINRQEVDILKNLNHMYLPQVLDFLSVDGEIFTVISFVPGKSFKELLDEGAHFKKKQLICWGMQLCSALHYLHNQNPPIIHGDIKPANMMLTPQGNICLIDFNISFFMDDSMVWGYTEGYTSPEQYIVAVDKKSASAIPERSIIDEKSDIYSVGATFYHLITGEKLKRQRDGYEETRLVNECDNFKEEYYRDYAIALAYEGDLEKAGDILNKAIKQNLTEDSIYYAKGEIEKASSEWEQAEDDLRRCIEITEDEELKMRAYILISEIYDKQDKKIKNERYLQKLQMCFQLKNR